MIARVESHRNKPQLSVAEALFHHLEAANTAHDTAHDGGNEDRTAALLAYRAMIVQRITSGTAESGAL